MFFVFFKSVANIDRKEGKEISIKKNRESSVEKFNLSYFIMVIGKDLWLKTCIP